MMACRIEGGEGHARGTFLSCRRHERSRYFAEQDLFWWEHTSQQDGNGYPLS